MVIYQLKIIIASHGDYSKGVVSSLNVIFGNSLPYEVETFSLYTGEDVNDLLNDLTNSISTEETTIILTDLYGGSVDNSLISLIGHKNVRIISGINMALVLEMMTLTETDHLDNDINRIIESARKGLVSKNYMYDQFKNEQVLNDDL